MAVIYEEQLITVVADGSMGADFFSPPVEIYGFECGSVQFSWTGADRTTARVIPQVSDDGVNYCNYVPEANAKRVEEPDGCGMYELQKFCFRYLRVQFLKKTNTAGQITILTYAKRLRYYA